jgi:hypothetical protein
MRRENLRRDASSCFSPSRKADEGKRTSQAAIEPRSTAPNRRVVLGDQKPKHSQPPCEFRTSPRHRHSSYPDGLSECPLEKEALAYTDSVTA